MKGDKILSVFVDESGMFKYPDPDSRFYIVGLVFHDQDVDITPLVRQMDRSADELGLDTEVFTFQGLKGQDLIASIGFCARAWTR